MRIDLHVHTAERSDCGKSPESLIIARAKEIGLDAIVFTDHERLPPPGHLDMLNEIHAPFKIFPGIEIACSGEHIVVVGSEDPILEKGEWTEEELSTLTARLGAFHFLAHPFRFGPSVTFDVAAWPPPAAERNSVNMGHVDEALLDRFFKTHQVHPLANSDAHHEDYVGVYHNLLDRPARTSAELVEILHEGAFTCRRMERRIAGLNAAGEKQLR